jgi:hypothetical protein
VEQRLSLVTLGVRDPGVFIDLEGHPWEVAHNPHWGLLETGSVRLNPAG